MVLFPQPAGPVTIRIWWWFAIVIVDAGAGIVADVLEGDAGVDIGGVGAAYCRGFDCDCSIVCNMVGLRA
jgi:hypothetical protein